MALLKVTHFWSNLLAWGYQHIFQSDGTIEWKATERSEGASKKFLRAIYYHLPVHCTLRYGTLLMVPQAGARDRMENVLEYIIDITMEINFSSKVYSKSLIKGSPLSCTSLE